MRVLLDENFPLRLVDRLRSHEIECDHVILMGERSATDSWIRQHVASGNLLLLTQDKDFLDSPPNEGVTIVSSVPQAFRSMNESRSGRERSSTTLPTPRKGNSSSSTRAEPSSRGPAGSIARLTERTAWHLPGFGNGCKGTGGIATLSGTPPWIGEVFTVTVSNLRASGVAVVFLGSSKTRWGTIPLPLDLAPLGAAGCKLYTDPLLPDGLVIQRGSAQRVALVPNLAAFVGVRFFQQAMIPDAGANAFGLVFSNGGEARVGSK